MEQRVVFQVLAGLVVRLLLTGQFIDILAYAEGIDGYDRARRSSDSDCKDKFKVVGGHSACLKTSDKFTSGGLKDGDKELIVALHNSYRAMVGAKNMLKMVWDDEVAMVAQHWAENCEITHDKSVARSIPGRFGTGQNIASGSLNSGLTWNSTLALWYAENKVFKYGGKNSYMNVGHYTQVVWANTAAVGCGMARCNDQNFLVCNYAPGGNVGNINKPYEAGDKCAACPDHCSEDKLCECGGKICENGGTRDLKTCECNCTKFYKTPTCGLNCDDVKQPFFCGKGQFAKSKCSSTQVMSMCPKVCCLCPYAGIGYTDDNSKDVDVCYGGVTKHTVTFTGLLIQMITTLIYLSVP